MFFSGSNRNPCLLPVLAMLLGGALLTACDGNSGSSGRPPPPPLGKADVLVYQSAAADGIPARLYKVNRSGESVLLSGAAGEASVTIHAVSPDTERVAYGYPLGNGQSALVIQSLVSGEPVPPALVVEGGVLRLQWLPDAQGLVYVCVVSGEAGFTQTLYLAKPGDPDPVQLIGTDLGKNGVLDFALSADGGRVAVAINYFDVTGGISPEVPESAALYLVDLSAHTGPSLIETATGDANSFKLAWSPHASELAYQRRLLTPYTSGSISTNHPVGPMRLLDAQGQSHALREIAIDEGWTPWTWLGAGQILVSGFQVISSDGSLLASRDITGGGKVVPSPDRQRLAFVDKVDGGEPQAYILDLATGEYRVAGPASSIFVYRCCLDSELAWSADGSWLAWNRDLDFEQTTGELYAHNIDSGETRTVAPDLGSNGQLSPLPRVSWLPEGNVLDYVVRTSSGFAYTTADLESRKTVTVGNLSALGCTVKLGWPSNREALWNRCGDGLYLSGIGKNESVTRTRLLDREVYSWAFGLTANRQIAVMQPVDVVADDPGNTPAPNWQMYDAIEQRMIELDGTSGSTCCGTLLQ